MSAPNPKLFEFYDGGDNPENKSLETEITLRDLFAMAAVVQLAIVAGPQERTAGADLYAAWAYKLADAMLAERAKKS